MIHIVFNEADIAVLEQAIALDDNLQGTVLQIKDDFAVGPIMDIYETYGYQQRRDWWQQVLEHSPYTEQLNIVNDKLTVHNLQQQLQENTDEQIWIWMGQNAHDVCGYYWLMPQLKDYQGRVHILYLNNLPFINEKGGIFYPAYLHEIQPKEFLKAKKLARPITLSEFEIDPDEWKKLCNENGSIRLLEGGKKIVNNPEHFFDKEIIGFITKDYQKLTKWLQHCSNKMKIKTGDAFLVYRLKNIALLHNIEIKGNWEKGWKDIELKLNAE